MVIEKKIFLAAADLPNTRQSLRILLDALEASDLGKTSEIQICHTHNFSWDLESELSCYDLDLKFLDTGYSEKHHEYPVLHGLWKACQNSDFYVLYLHTKGASKTTMAEQRNACAWTRIMLHGVLDNYQLCEKHLDAGADLVGSLWYWHFKGNFWWARSDYLRTLTDPIQMDHDYRNHAEFWCAWGNWWGRHSPPKVKNLFYLKNYQNDNSFLEIVKNQKISDIDLQEQVIFVDSRLDPGQTFSIEQHLENFDLRVFDTIYIPTESRDLVPRLKLFLNYDGAVFVCNTKTQQVEKIRYQDI